MCVWLKSLPSSCAGPWRGLASSGLPVEALERGLDLEGPAKGLAMEPKEEPDWEAEQVPSRNKKKSWADLAAEEKKDPPKKDAHHGQKKEWWEEDWKKGGKSWDDWWEEKEGQWQAWSKKQRWKQDGEETEIENEAGPEREVASSSTQQKNKCGSQKEKAKRRWLMGTCKNESQEEKERLKLGALGGSRMKRLLSRQEDRKNALQIAEAAEKAAANAAAAAQAAQATAAAAQWHQWQVQQAQVVEAQAMWHHQAYYQGQHQHPQQWGWHQAMEQPEQVKQPKPQRHQPGLVGAQFCLSCHSHVCWLCFFALQDQWLLAVLQVVLGLDQEESHHSMQTIHALHVHHGASVFVVLNTPLWAPAATYLFETCHVGHPCLFWSASANMWTQTIVNAPYFLSCAALGRPHTHSIVNGLDLL